MSQSSILEAVQKKITCTVNETITLLFYFFLVFLFAVLYNLYGPSTHGV